MSEWDHTANFLGETIKILRLAHFFGTSGILAEFAEFYELRLAQKKGKVYPSSFPGSNGGIWYARDYLFRRRINFRLFRFGRSSEFDNRLNR